MFRCPKKILFLDDDPTFLEDMKKSLRSEQRGKACFSPYFLQESSGVLSHLNRNAIEGRYPGYDPQNMGRYLGRADRFEAVSVLVTDQEMPAMTGLAFLKQLRERLPHFDHLKKILLTGYVKDEAAIDAFNAGDIHSFVRKDDPHLIPALMAQINRFQEQIQYERGRTPLDHVVTQLMQTYNMIECYPLDESVLNVHGDGVYGEDAYLVDAEDTGERADYDIYPHFTGSHLLVDAEGDMIHVQVHTSKSLYEDLTFAKSQLGRYGDDKEAQQVITALTKQDKAFSHFNLFEPDPIPEPYQWILGDCQKKQYPIGFEKTREIKSASIIGPDEKCVLRDLQRTEDPETKQEVLYTITPQAKDPRVLPYARYSQQPWIQSIF